MAAAPPGSPLIASNLEPIAVSVALRSPQHLIEGHLLPRVPIGRDRRAALGRRSPASDAGQQRDFFARIGGQLPIPMQQLVSSWACRAGLALSKP